MEKRPRILRQKYEVCIVAKDHIFAETNIRVGNELAEAASRLTVLERHVLFYTMVALRSEDTHFKVFRMNLKDMADTLEMSVSNYSQILNAVRDLMESKVIIKEKNNTTSEIIWISSIRYPQDVCKNPKGWVDIKFNDDLKPYLLQLKGKRYMTTEMLPLLQVKNTYGIKLLEYVRKWWNWYPALIKEHRVSVARFRELLGLSNFGKLKDMHVEYRNFRIKVLERAIKEINDKSDIYIMYKDIRRGKKVIGLLFYFAEKESSEYKFGCFQDFQNLSEGKERLEREREKDISFLEDCEINVNL